MDKDKGSLGDFIGLDIGGSKTQGVRWHDGKIVATAKAGSANVQNVTPETAALNLAELFGQLGAASVSRVIAGSGGVDTAEDARALAALISPHAPGATVEVVHDTRLIMAAGGASTGIAVIVGTGTAAWGTDSGGRQARSGGWGYLLGDEGSGYWVGREAVRHTLHRHDLGQEQDELGRRVVNANGVDSPAELIALFHGNTGRRYWAEQASLVFDAYAEGHKESAEILNAAAEHISVMIQDVAQVLGVRGPVIIGGGLAVNQPIMQQLISTRLENAGLQDVTFLTQDPVMGVAYLVAVSTEGGMKANQPA